MRQETVSNRSMDLLYNAAVVDYEFMTRLKEYDGPSSIKSTHRQRVIDLYAAFKRKT